MCAKLTKKSSKAKDLVMEGNSRFTQTPISVSPLRTAYGGIEDNAALRRRHNLFQDPVLPCPFVVLQGMPGDGMKNTIDFPPMFPLSLLIEGQGRSGIRHRECEQGADVDLDERGNSDDSSFFHADDNIIEMGDENAVRRSESLSSNVTGSLVHNFYVADVDSVNDSDFHHVNANSPETTRSSAPIASSPIEENESTEDSSSMSAMLSSLESSTSNEQQRLSAPPFLSASANHTSSSIQQNSSISTTASSQQNNSLQRATSSTNFGENSFILVQEAAEAITQPPSSRIAASRSRRREEEIAGSIRNWHNECQEREERNLNEFVEANAQRQNSVNGTGSETVRNTRRRNLVNETETIICANRRWWQRDGKLLIFKSVPTLSAITNDGLNSAAAEVIGDLHPGCSILGTEIVAVDGKMFELEHFYRSSKTQKSTYQFLRIESPVCGYVFYRYGAYCVVAHGLPTSFCQPSEWIWRVLCPDGAYVRRGLELNSRQITILPHGSLVKVTRKTVNAMGLSRLKIAMDSNVCSSGNQGTCVEGWVSEVLNPLSGQHGSIMQPLPFPAPALYRVTLSGGAVIRAGVELSSVERRIAPPGSILKIVGRAFSEYPADQCIERLRLAGNGGWVSVRLNRPPPHDHLVVQLVGVDGSFQPGNIGRYHLDAQREVEASSAAVAYAVQNNRNFEERRASNSNGESKNENSDSAAIEDRSRRQASMEPAPYGGENYRPEDKCLICLTEERTSTIVHAGTGHIACCLTCARILKARGDKCPVCRLPIDSVIQQFWA